MDMVMLVLLFVALVIATYRDLQIREVPDTISYGTIVLGLLGGLLVALVQKDAFIFFEHLAGFAIAALLGLFMYYTKQWGGGDAKLIMGVGAVLGFSFTNFMLIEFLLLLILAGAVYGMFATAWLAIKSRKQFVKGFKVVIRERRVHTARIVLVVTVVVLLIFLFLAEWPMQLFIGVFIVALYVLTYAWIFMQVVEQYIMTKQYPVSKLVEGDWLIDDVKKGKKVVVNALNTGVTKKQIQQLKKAKVKTVTVREGIAFVPSFLLAYIALLILQHTYGSLLTLIL